VEDELALARARRRRAKFCIHLDIEFRRTGEGDNNSTLQHSRLPSLQNEESNGWKLSIRPMTESTKGTLALGTKSFSMPWIQTLPRIGIAAKLTVRLRVTTEVLLLKPLVLRLRLISPILRLEALVLRLCSIVEAALLESLFSRWRLEALIS
jgi:hypothetical protein